MGGVDQICTDKTGTLTKNQMETKAVYMFGRVITDEELLQLKLDEAVKDRIIDSILYNCTSYIEQE
jgi:P-type E1-E2 ATPase